MKTRIFLLLLLIAFSFPAKAAEISIGNSTLIKDTYTPGQNLAGTINLSLKDIPSSALLESSAGGGINIKSFLNNASARYTCKPLDCGIVYAESNPNSSKTISLSPGEQKTIGIRVEGQMNEIKDFSLDVKSNALSSCANPLSIDILDDKDIQYTFNESVEDFSCYTTKGCFSPDAQIKEVNFDENEYCEKMTLAPAPAYQLGAVLKKSGAPVKLTMRLKGVDNNNQSFDLPEDPQCILDDSKITGSFSEAGCVLNYPIVEQNRYYVCVSSEKESNYSIQYEIDESKGLCGYHSFLEENYTVDYALFAKAAKYAPFKNFTFNQDTQNVNSLGLGSYISSYIANRFNNDCKQGCIVPITFSSGVQQNITLENGHLSYSTNVGPKLENNFYDIERKDAEISLAYQLLDISYANLKIPSVYGNFKINLFINGISLLSKEIAIKKVPVVSSVFPKTVPQSVKTTFTLAAKSPENKTLTRYVWDFGDNITAESSIPEIEHAYTNLGIYILTVTAIDDVGNEGEGTFQIIVGSAKNAVNQSILEMRSRIASITSVLSNKWYKDAIEGKMKLPDAEKQLNEVEKLWLTAKTDEDYSRIIQRLNSISLPNAIRESNTINVPFIFEIKDLNFANLEQLGAGSAQGKEDAYRNAIWAWFSETNNHKEYKILSAVYGKESEIIGASMKLDIGGEGENYIIIDKSPDYIQFLTQEKTTNLGSSTGVSCTGKKILEFFISGNINPETLPIYAAPRLDSLEINVKVQPCNYNSICESDLGENSDNCKADCKPVKKTLIYLVLILIAAFIIYTLAQEWYRKRYEKNLFKNDADKFNLITFVGNARKQGLKNEDIIKKLKQSNWNSEQISFVFKKIEGKRVGLPGLNILEILERRRNKKRFNNPQNMVGGGNSAMPGRLNKNVKYDETFK